MIKGFEVSESQETFCYAFTRELSIIGGPTNNGGIALQWLKELIEYEGQFDELTAEAEQVAPGAEGLLFLAIYKRGKSSNMESRSKG